VPSPGLSCDAALSRKQALLLPERTPTMAMTARMKQPGRTHATWRKVSASNASMICRAGGVVRGCAHAQGGTRVAGGRGECNGATGQAGGAGGASRAAQRGRAGERQRCRAPCTAAREGRACPPTSTACSDDSSGVTTVLVVCSIALRRLRHNTHRCVWLASLCRAAQRERRPAGPRGPAGASGARGRRQATPALRQPTDPERGLTLRCTKCRPTRRRAHETHHHGPSRRAPRYT